MFTRLPSTQRRVQYPGKLRLPVVPPRHTNQPDGNSLFRGDVTMSRSRPRTCHNKVYIFFNTCRNVWQCTQHTAAECKKVSIKWLAADLQR